MQFQLGKRLALGPRQYRLRGYCANRFASGFHHEPHLLPVLERVLSGSKGAFVDIGVNVGQTLTKVLTLDPTRRYVGFEPQIACCFFVDQFLRDNDITHAHVLPMALYDANRVCLLYSNNEYDEMASLVGEIDGSGRKRQSICHVPCRIGDEVFDELGLNDIAVIKIDVEGAELQALTGLAQTLKRRRPVIIFEVLPNFYGALKVLKTEEMCARNSFTADRLYAFLSEAEYEIRQLTSNGEERAVQRFNLNDLSGYLGSDFIAYPHSR